MKNNLVVKSNDLIEASYLLTRAEQNLILACISQIDTSENAPETTAQDDYFVTVEDFKKNFYKESNKDNAYRDLEGAAIKLFRREVTIKLEGRDTLLTSFVASVLFQPDDSRVLLNFSKQILPYLTQLKRNFTSYRLGETIELRSVYAVRLYELIVCWAGQNQWRKSFDLDEFRYLMGVTGKYKQFGQLRTSVIDVAIKQINENTRYHVSVDYKKIVRSYNTIILKYHRKDLPKSEQKSSELSQSKIARIVQNQQFERDYNNHKMLSGEAQKSVIQFRSEASRLLKDHPDEFTKRPFSDYLQ